MRRALWTAFKAALDEQNDQRKQADAQAAQNSTYTNSLYTQGVWSPLPQQQQQQQQYNHLQPPPTPNNRPASPTLSVASTALNSPSPSPRPSAPALPPRSPNPGYARPAAPGRLSPNPASGYSSPAPSPQHAATVSSPPARQTLSPNDHARRWSTSPIPQVGQRQPSPAAPQARARAVSATSARQAPAYPVMSPPQSVPGINDEPTRRKILCLDGGGVRGLSEILMLRELMRRLARERGFAEGETIEPWQEFDMICGTSTGGLLAVMLGRLRMTLKECLEAYVDLSSQLFKPARRDNSGASDPQNAFLSAEGRFSAEPLERKMKLLLGRRNMPEDTLLWDRSGDAQACLVFVCATSSHGGPTCIRSYRNPQVYDDLIEDCKVWQAVRATSAASTFFPPISIGWRTFLDGAHVGDNNPIEVADTESAEMFKGQERMIVSLGTGKGVPRDISGRLSGLMHTLTDMLSESERRNNRFHDSHRDWAANGQLFRFNVASGLGEVGLEEHLAIGRIAEFTALYFQEPGVTTSLDRCAQALRGGGQRLDIVGGEELALHLEKLEVSSRSADRCVHCLQGIPFNSDMFYCQACRSKTCPSCRHSHEMSHYKDMVRVELVMWQKKMKEHAERQTCQECLVAVRCRFECSSCNFIVCFDCLSDVATLKKLWDAHKARYPEHRLLTQISSPWTQIDPPLTADCTCLTGPFPIEHCSQCTAVMGLSDVEYTCRTCSQEFAHAQSLCQKCYDADAQHRAEHEFQTFLIIMEERPDGDVGEQTRQACRCLECGQTFSNWRAVSHHPHRQYGVFYGPQLMELHRKGVIVRCPKMTDIDEGRPQPTKPASGSSCNFCGFVLDYDTPLAICLMPACGFIACELCTRTGRHAHRHLPMQELYIVKHDGAVGTGQLTCDLCKKQLFKAAFVGLECRRCFNEHYCHDCVGKVDKGELSYRGNGHHGCQQPSWNYWRF